MILTKSGVISGQIVFSAALNDFQRAGHGDTTTAAQRGQTKCLALVFQRMKQGHHDPAAGGTHRVAQADAGAVDVGDFAVQVQVTFAADILGGEGFVQFHEVEVGDGQLVAVHQIIHGRYRGKAHD